MAPSTVNLQHAGKLVSASNPLPVTPLPPTTATGGTAAAIAAIDAAPDKETDFTYLDEGTDDQRIETVTYSSATLGLSYVETFTYAGSAGSYRVSNIARS